MISHTTHTPPPPAAAALSSSSSYHQAISDFEGLLLLLRFLTRDVIYTSGSGLQSTTVLTNEYDRDVHRDRQTHRQTDRRTG